MKANLSESVGKVKRSLSLSFTLNKTVVKSRQAAFDKEDKQTQILTSRFNEDFKSPKKANMDWWKKQLKKLEKEEDSENAELNNMIARLRYKTYAMAYERMIFGTPKSNSEQVDFCKQLIKLIYPKFNRF